MSQDSLTDFVKATAEEFGIPGVAVGVWADGQEMYACHGITSLENPLPVDQDTLFQLGSVTKTYTATALMRLVQAGQVELDAPVSHYVPELKLSDEQAAAKITVMNLLNHTAGLGWGVIVDTGDGEDALAGYVAKMAELEQIGQPGERASYSQAGYNLAGRIIEKVTGLTYEQAIASLVLEPLAMSNTFFASTDVMTRRFAVGHNLEEDGTSSIARPWKMTRGDHPGGGIVSSVADQLRWAQFHLGNRHLGNRHLGNGHAESSRQVLSTDVLHQMKKQTVALRASTLGDGLGIGWFLRDVDGVRTVGHGGSAIGQFAELLLVPERNFAIIVTSNASPNGLLFDQAVVRWALKTYLGVIDQDPEPAPYDEARAYEIIGNYGNDAMTYVINTDGAVLKAEVLIRPEIRAAADTELPQDHAPFVIGLLPDKVDEYIVTSGAMKGQRGFFTRDASGAVTGVDLAGRLFGRVPKP